MRHHVESRNMATRSRSEFRLLDNAGSASVVCKHLLVAYKPVSLLLVVDPLLDVDEGQLLHLNGLVDGAECRCFDSPGYLAHLADFSCKKK